MIRLTDEEINQLIWASKTDLSKSICQNCLSILLKAQARKIFDEAKRQGIIDVYNGNLITIDNSGKHWNFWNKLKKEIEG
jgi:hypothetical protein